MNDIFLLPTDGDPPTMQFYYGDEIPNAAKKNAFCIPLEDSFWSVPTIKVNINGVDLKAIIDTGSPITILNTEAAEKVGIGNTLSKEEEEDTSFLIVKGVDDDNINLIRSKEGASLSIGGDFSLGDIHVCVGNLPGIAFASSLSSSAEPQVLLGLDALRRTYRMILSTPKNEVWFEQLPEKFMPIALQQSSSKQ